MTNPPEGNSSEPGRNLSSRRREFEDLIRLNPDSVRGDPNGFGEYVAIHPFQEELPSLSNAVQVDAEHTRSIDAYWKFRGEVVLLSLESKVARDPPLPVGYAARWIKSAPSLLNLRAVLPEPFITLDTIADTMRRFASLAWLWDSKSAERIGETWTDLEISPDEPE